MHLSARSELKSELADSRIETKLRINKCGLLHVCLTDVCDSHAGALKCRSCSKGRHAPLACVIELMEARESSRMRKGEPHCRGCNEARQERRFHRLLAAPCYRSKKNGPRGSPN